MTEVSRSRVPLMVAGFYAAIVLLLFTFAMASYDEFGFRFIPVLYATYPLSLFLEKQCALHNLFVSVAAGGAMNAGILYALTSAFVYVRKTE